MSSKEGESARGSGRGNERERATTGCRQLSGGRPSFDNHPLTTYFVLAFVSSPRGAHGTGKKEGGGSASNACLGEVLRLRQKLDMYVGHELVKALEGGVQHCVVVAKYFGAPVVVIGDRH